MSRNKLKSKGRKSGKRPYRKLFIIIVEGETEKQYFRQRLFNNKRIKVVSVTGKHSDPESLLDTADAKAKRERLIEGDRVWIVLDRDDQDNAEMKRKKLQKVFDWRARESFRQVAFSSPQFEYWLLLHYEKGGGVTTKKDCLDRLNRHLDGNYRKNVEFNFSRDEIEQACERSQKRVDELNIPIDKMASIITLDHSAYSTVHILVEDMLSSIYSISE